MDACFTILLGILFLGHFHIGVSFLETFHATGGVHDLLLPRHEGVAFRADFNLDVFLRRPGLYNVAAHAADCCFNVFRVDPLFHILFSPPSGGTPLHRGSRKGWKYNQIFSNFKKNILVSESFLEPVPWTLNPVPEPLRGY
jgi:hypothetical protein